MNDLHQTYPRLALLVNQLCDQQLDQAGADELSRIVRTDPHAREWYVRYLDLHASLLWDAATPLRGESVSAIQGDFASQQSAGLQELMTSLLAEAAAESTEVSLHSITPVPVTRRLSPRQWILTAVTSLGVLLALITGFSRIAPSTGNGQLAETSLPAPNVSPTKTDSNERTEKLAAQKETSAEELPPELPQLHWGTLGQPASPSSRNSLVKQEKDRSPSGQNALTDDREIIVMIDGYIERGWQDSQVTPSPRADDYEWIRRVYLDLAGRIPSPQEVQAFVGSSSPQREQELVQHLLDSPDFALQWSSRWTNLLVGRSPEERVDRVALQGYLREAIENQQSWSLVVQDLISAEGDPRENGAANFLVAHLNNQAVPATAFVARTLLGSQIHCAQCHKHPFYDISQQEFWELNSFFKQAVVKKTASPQTDSMNTQLSGYQLTDEEKGGPIYFETLSGVMKVAYPKFNGQEVAPSENVSRREELAKILTIGEEPQIARAFVNRTWSHLFGFGFTNPVDDLGPHNPPTHPELFSQLSRAFVQHDYNVKKLIGWICLSKPYRLSSRKLAGNAIDAPERGELPAFSRMYFKPLTAEQLYDSLLLIKGDYAQLRSDWKTHIAEREHWVGQFVNSLQNDENDESNHFDGTISQALVLMNGDLVLETISPQASAAMEHVTANSTSDQQKFEELCLSVLSRKPTTEELAMFRKLTRPLREVRNPTEREMLLASRLEDVLWAYLNSSEFIMNH